MGSHWRSNFYGFNCYFRTFITSIMLFGEWSGQKSLKLKMDKICRMGPFRTMRPTWNSCTNDKDDNNDVRLSLKYKILGCNNKKMEPDGYLHTWYMSFLNWCSLDIHIRTIWWTKQNKTNKKLIAFQLKSYIMAVHNWLQEYLF